ncbi:MAG: hypothetical protein MUF71_16345 [Candidatus Kapabacteria bacterium]|jgi:hypothetical protein|nr:hypothetical protein [Candidatus Kapabacteria bacterium]
MPYLANCLAWREYVFVRLAATRTATARIRFLTAASIVAEIHNVGIHDCSQKRLKMSFHAPSKGQSASCSAPFSSASGIVGVWLLNLLSRLFKHRIAILVAFLSPDPLALILLSFQITRSILLPP